MASISSAFTSSFFPGRAPFDVLPRSGNTVAIGYEHFRDVFERRGMPADAIQTLFKSIDTDRDGRVTKADVLRVMKRYQEESGDHAVEASADTASPHPQEQRHDPSPSPVIDEAAIRAAIEALARKATSYTRTGARSFFVKGTYVNRFA